MRSKDADNHDLVDYLDELVNYLLFLFYLLYNLVHGLPLFFVQSQCLNFCETCSLVGPPMPPYGNMESPNKGLEKELGIMVYLRKIIPKW